MKSSSSDLHQTMINLLKHVVRDFNVLNVKVNEGGSVVSISVTADGLKFIHH